jgi:ribosomal protein L11 methyltransferase
MDYAELRFDNITGEDEKSLLTAWLLDKGFESFVEEEDALLAYIGLQDMDEAWLEARDMPVAANIKVSWKTIREQNWNETWERSYEPVRIGQRCIIRAPFHDAGTNYEFEIVIEPKMSFGTAHHDTTALMIEHMLEMDITGSSVLDMGCGTAVLAILACMSGAAQVMAVDNDRWAYENALENVSRNDCGQVDVKEGDASLLQGRKFDIILANINRNVLIEDIPAYAEALNKGGILLLSGFYHDDLQQIVERAEAHRLFIADSVTRNDWVAANFFLQT